MIVEMYVRRVLVLGGALLLAGCVTAIFPKEWNLYDQGRSVEQIVHMEAKIATLDHPATLDYYLLCDAYARVKVYDKLFDCLDKLDAELAASGDTSWIGLDFRPYAKRFRADAQIDLGNYDEAVRLAEEAYRAVIEYDVQRYIKIAVLPTLGVANALAGNLDRAAEATALLEDTGTYYPFSLLKPDKEAGLARMYMAVGRYEDAANVDLDLDPFAAFAAGLGGVVAGYEMRQNEIIVQNFIKAKAVYLSGRYEEATGLYDDLLQIEQVASFGGVYWQVLHDRGQIAERQGDMTLATDYYSRAINVFEAQRTSINSEVSKIGYAGNKQTVYGDMVGILLAQGRDEDAFAYAERGKARALVDMLAARRSFVTVEEDPVLIASLLDELDRREKDSVDLVADLATENTRSALELTRSKIRQSAPELASLVTVSSLNASVIQNLIAEDEILIEYYGDENNLIAFVVSRNDVKAIRLQSKGLEAAISRFRLSLLNYKTDDWQRPSEDLHEQLIAPLSKYLKGNNLLIVPHGMLHYLPFNALYDGHDYLVDRYAIRLLPSASVLAFLKPRTKKASGLLILGNPDLQNPSLDLPGAQAEALAIASSWPGARVLLRENATETLFKKIGSQFSMLHLASHGQFVPDDPMASKMLLAKDDENDGNLTVDEIYDLRLDADLITLSACETGVGEVANGDDVVGLTRGFLYAGARSIVASLWPVSDAATEMLMKNFYINLKEGLSIRDGLRKAQQQTRMQYSHPVFWAAFQLTGNI